MKASVVDLRYRMKDVLGALKRRENIQIMYHGKVAGIIMPPTMGRRTIKAQDHPLFGLRRSPADQKRSVRQVMDQLRGGRYRDL